MLMKELESILWDARIVFSQRYLFLVHCTWTAYVRVAHVSLAIIPTANVLCISELPYSPKVTLF